MGSSVVSESDLAQTKILTAPHAFIDRRGYPILIRVFAEKWRKALTDFFLSFHPRGEFSGLPPHRDEECIRWVNGLIETGVNLMALSFEEGIVGHSGLYPVNRTTCELLVALDPSHRNLGIGTQLTRQIVQLAHELDFERVWLTVGPSNRIAQHVYAKCGFRFLPGDDRDELEMAADLRLLFRMGDVTVASVMNPDVVSIREDRPCEEAMEAMVRRHVGALPVVDDAGRMVGILSETDLIVAPSLDQAVRDVSTKQVVSVRPDCPLSKVVRLFQARKMRCIPVVDDEMHVVGIVGRRDVLTRAVQARESSTGIG